MDIEDVSTPVVATLQTSPATQDFIQQRPITLKLHHYPFPYSQAPSLKTVTIEINFERADKEPCLDIYPTKKFSMCWSTYKKNLRLPSILLLPRCFTG